MTAIRRRDRTEVGKPMGERRDLGSNGAGRVDMGQSESKAPAPNSALATSRKACWEARDSSSLLYYNFLFKKKVVWFLQEFLVSMIVLICFHDNFCHVAFEVQHLRVSCFRFGAFV